MSASTPTFTITGFESWTFAGQPMERWLIQCRDGVKVTIESKRPVLGVELADLVFDARYREWVSRGVLGTEIQINR